MKISLIIPTYNRAKELETALHSVLEQHRVPEEIVVVDDGNMNEQWLRNLIGNKAQLVYFKKDEPGLVKSRNKGVTLASGEIISFIDDDVVLPTNYFSVVEKIFEDDAEEKIGVVGGYIIPDNPHPLRLIKNGLERIFLMRGKPGSMLASTANTLVEKKPTHDIQVDWISGCNMNFRREVFEKGLRFDEFFTLYGLGEDAEFTYRVKKELGLQIVVTPRVEVHHYHTPTARIKERRLGYMMIANHHHIFHKLMPNTFFNRMKFWWYCVGNIVVEIFNRVSRPSRSRGGRVFGMIDALRGKEPQ